MKRSLEIADEERNAKRQRTVEILDKAPEWRKIEDFDYEVCEDGRIRNAVTSRILKAEINGGYARVVLYRNRKTYKRFVHRLVALAFIGAPPPGKLTVNHKNRKTSDNCVDNLEYASQRDQGKHAVATGVKLNSRAVAQYDIQGNLLSQFPSARAAQRATGVQSSEICNVCRNKQDTAGNCIWKYVNPKERSLVDIDPNLPGEQWKSITDFPSYQVSSAGRVRNRRGYVLASQNRNGYLRVFLLNGSIKGRFDVHRLVATAFLPNPTSLPQVDHINENKTDNRVENLRWATRSENTLAAVAVAVNQLTMDGKLIQRFASMKEAAKSIGVRAPNIWRCCNGWRQSCHDSNGNILMLRARTR